MGRRQLMLVGLAAWDLAWRVAAVRQALRRRQYKWAAALLLTSSAGVVPMLYLARTRGLRN